jgi:membrane associated rhomboid family serine protease
VVIPVHDVNPVRRAPWVTWALIAANVIVFLLTPTAPATMTGRASLAQECRLEAFYARWAAIPAELAHNRPLALAPTGQIGVGAQGAGCVIAPPSYHKSPVLSAFTGMFLHGSWLHLLGNMLFLFIFGNNVEDRFGRLRYLIFYLGCGLVAAYGFALANRNSTEVLIGASGAIAGVLGAYLIMFPRTRVWSLLPFAFFIPLPLPAWVVLGGWFLLQWAYAEGWAVTSVGSVAYLAHVYGFLAGVIVALIVRALSQDRRAPPPYPQPYR